MTGASGAGRTSAPLGKELQTAEVGAVLAPEIVEVLKGASSGQININILLEQVAANEHSPERALKHADALIGLSARYEEQRLTAFQARTRAIIEAKASDPDEVEKRSNNRVRRHLKLAIAGCALAGILGMLLSVATGGPIVVTGLLAAIGVVSVAMLGPLASGESVSSNDVVSIVTALGRVLGAKAEDNRPDRSNRKRR